MRFRLAMAGVVSVLGAACGGDDGSGPVIYELAPAQAQVGGTVDLIGARFCGDDPANVGLEGRCIDPPSGFVTFGTADGIDRADIAFWRAERITVTLPNVGPGAMSVVVTVTGRQSNAEAFQVVE
jgi:hypothetical protein